MGTKRICLVVISLFLSVYGYVENPNKIDSSDDLDSNFEVKPNILREYTKSEVQTTDKRGNIPNPDKPLSEESSKTSIEQGSKKCGCGCDCCCCDPCHCCCDNHCGGDDSCCCPCHCGHCAECCCHCPCVTPCSSVHMHCNHHECHPCYCHHTTCHHSCEPCGCCHHGCGCHSCCRKDDVNKCAGKCKDNKNPKDVVPQEDFKSQDFTDLCQE